MPRTTVHSLNVVVQVIHMEQIIGLFGFNYGAGNYAVSYYNDIGNTSTFLSTTRFRSSLGISSEL